MKSFMEWLEDKNRISEQEGEQTMTPDQVNDIANSLGGQIKNLPDLPGGSAKWWQDLLGRLSGVNKQVQQGVSQAAMTQAAAKTQTVTPATPTQSVR